MLADVAQVLPWTGLLLLFQPGNSSGGTTWCCLTSAEHPAEDPDPRGRKLGVTQGLPQPFPGTQGQPKLQGIALLWDFPIFVHMHTDCWRLNQMDSTGLLLRQA